MKKCAPNIISILVFLPFLAISVTAEKKTTVTKGPFMVGMGKNHRLSVNIESITRQGSFNNQIKCDVGLLIKDQDGIEVYRDQYTPEHDEDELSYGVDAVEVPKIGTALLISRNILPSAPGTGSSYRLFHFNPENEFVPISGLIAPYCNKINSDCFEIVEYGDRSIPSIRSEKWTTFLHIVYHYPIDPNGIQTDKAVPIVNKNVPVEVDIEETVTGRENYAKWYPDKGNRITLYSKMDLNDLKTESVSVSPESEIQYLDATPYNHKKDTCYWLHIIIDGKEGYVTGLEDFMKLGLPFAG